MRLGLNGAPSLYLNGVDVAKRQRALYAEDDGEGEDLLFQYVIPIGIIGLGIGIFAGVDTLR